VATYLVNRGNVYEDDNYSAHDVLFFHSQKVAVPIVSCKMHLYSLVKEMQSVSPIASIQRSFKNIFTNVAVWQALRIQIQIRWLISNYVCKFFILCFICQRCYVVCGKKLTTGLPHYQWKSYWTITIVKLGAFCYIMTVLNTVHVLWINLYKVSTL
jgi:hypothetical protein